MATKYAVLGLIMERRGYGYDLAQRLAERLGPAWQLNPAAVYQALNQLEADGMVESFEQPSPPLSDERRRLPRLVYEATERGREAFRAWLLAPVLRQEPIRSELALKLAVAQASNEELRGMIDGAERLLQGALGEYRDSEEPGAPWKPTAVARTAALFRLEGELDWLATVRPLLFPVLR